LTCSKWIILRLINNCAHWIISSNILTNILKLLGLAYRIHYSHLRYWLSLIDNWHSLSVHSTTPSSWLAFSRSILLYNLLLCLIQNYLLCIIFKEINLSIGTCSTHIVYHIRRLLNILWICQRITWYNLLKHLSLLNYLLISWAHILRLPHFIRFDRFPIL
jgi:hypothetical protein